MYKQIIITLLLHCFLMIVRTYEAMKNNQSRWWNIFQCPPNYRHPSLQSASSRSVSWDLIIIVFFFCFSSSSQSSAMTLSFIVMSGEWNFFFFILLRIPSLNWSPSRHHLRFRTHRIITTLQTKIIMMELYFFFYQTFKQLSFVIFVVPY